MSTSRATGSRPAPLGSIGPRRRRHGLADVSPCALRRRFRGHGDRDSRARGGVARTSGGGPRRDRASAVPGEDEDRTHRRWFRLPRLPHPARRQARATEDVRLHLPLEEGARVDHEPRSRRSPGRARTSRWCDPAAPTQLALRGWTTYFRHGGVQGRPSATCATTRGAGSSVAAAQTPPRTWKSLRRRYLPSAGGGRTHDGIRSSTRRR